MSKLKYLCVLHGLSAGVKSTLEEVPRRGGFYNWLFAFKGDIMPWKNIEAQGDAKSFLERYDVVHLNMAPVDQLLIPEIRKALGKSSSTKFVINNDYVAEQWHKWNIHPKQYWHLQGMGDMVFGTEPCQVSHMIPRAKTIPHPHWIKMLKKMAPSETENSYGVLYHWWEGKTHSPAIFDFKLKKEFPKIESKFYAYREDVAEDKRWLRTFWDYKVPPMNFPEYIDDLMTNKFVYEPTNSHTYGRNSVDLAAIGIPMIGSDRVWSMKYCFPKTSHDPWRMDKTLNVARRILKESRFRQEVIDYAQDACEFFNYKNSKERFIAALEESEKDEKEYLNT